MWLHNKSRSILSCHLMPLYKEIVDDPFIAAELVQNFISFDLLVSECRKYFHLCICITYSRPVFDRAHKGKALYRAIFRKLTLEANEFVRRCKKEIERLFSRSLL